MTRLHHVKKARKSIKGTDIKKGDSYYWWQFAFRSKQVSKTRPRRSQYATQSEHLGAIYDLEDQLADMKTGDIAEGCLDDIINEIDSIIDTCQERLDNMPEQLQEAPSGQILQEYIFNCENWKNDLEAIDFEDLNQDFNNDAENEIDENEYMEEGEVDEDAYQGAIIDRAEELEEEARQSILDEIQGCTYPG